MLSKTLLVHLTLAFSAAAFGSTVYSNTATDTTDTLAYAGNGFSQIGDEITLAGTDRYAIDATVQFFSDGGAGTFDATLRLFDAGSPVGPQIGSDFAVTGVAAPAGDVVNVTFDLGGILIPDNLVFTASVGNFSSGVDILGVDMFEPPTIGSSDPTFAIANDGTNFSAVATANEDVYFQLDATTPEPATLFLCGGGLLLLAGIRRRNRLTRARVN